MVLGGGIPSGNLKSLKVVELQKKLRDLGLPASGKKEDLVKRLEEALEKDTGQGDKPPPQVKDGSGNGAEAAAAVPASAAPSQEAPAKAPTSAPPQEEPAAAKSVDFEPQADAVAPKAGSSGGVAPENDDSKGKKRTISVRGAEESSTPTQAGQNKSSLADAVIDTDGAVTADSILAMADAVGVGQDDDNDNEKEDMDTAQPQAKRVAREVYKPTGVRTQRAEGTTPSATQVQPRPDGVRGRGANMFQRAAAQIAPRKEPPAQRPEKCLRLEGLKRPFTDKQLREHVEESCGGGAVSWMWLNRIKSVCFCEFASSDEASAARRALYDVQWPPVTGGSIIASFITRDEAESVVSSEPAAKPIGARLGVLPQGAPARGETAPSTNTLARSTAGSRNVRGEAPAAGRGAEERRDQRADAPKSLDELFYKSKSKPEVYWTQNSADTKARILNQIRGKSGPLSPSQNPTSVPLPPPIAMPVRPRVH